MTTDATAPTDLLIVDVDTHLSEPWDLWLQRAPRGYEDRVPQVKDVDDEQVGRRGGVRGHACVPPVA